MQVAGFAPVVHPRDCRYPAGYGWAKRVSTAWGEATARAAGRLFVDQAETRRDAAASGEGCGAVGAHTVVVGAGGAVVAVVADAGGADVPWVLVHPAARATKAQAVSNHRIAEKVAAQ